MSVRSDFGRLHWDVSCDFDGEEGEGGGGGGGAWRVEGGAWSVLRSLLSSKFCILDASRRF